MIGLPNLERVILTGFMGSGKTTVGRLLAARLRWSFADLDDAVEKQQGLTVPEIFAQQGEQAFRTAEAEALAGLLKQASVVIALGGGAAAEFPVRALVAGAGKTMVVHLDADFDTLEERCLRQAQDSAATSRPLLRDASAARRRFVERAPFYAMLAQQRVDVSVAGPHAVVEEILAAWSTPGDSRSP